MDKPTANPKSIIKRIIRKCLWLCLILLSLFSISITLLDDPVSTTLRQHTEQAVNQHIEGMRVRQIADKTTSFDRFACHVAVNLGRVIGWLAYPEAGHILTHYAYGNGEPLELDAGYFSQSQYLQQQINKLGTGDHGPLTMRITQDPRVALALNPYYLKITEHNIELYHPRIAFANSKAATTITPVQIGKLRIVMIDNLLHILQPEPFKVTTSWARKNNQEK